MKICAKIKKTIRFRSQSEAFCLYLAVVFAHFRGKAANHAMAEK